jgi:hypothetical protein
MIGLLGVKVVTFSETEEAPGLRLQAPVPGNEKLSYQRTKLRPRAFQDSFTKARNARTSTNSIEIFRA